jgi:hypothetical protein
LYNPDRKEDHPEYLALIKHLISVLPDSLEQKSSEGWTPLHLAGALTPLAYWMAKNNGNHKKSDIVEILTSYSSGEELEMINGEGDLPLHVVSSQTIQYPKSRKWLTRTNRQ